MKLMDRNQIRFPATSCRTVHEKEVHVVLRFRTQGLTAVVPDFPHSPRETFVESVTGAPDAVTAMTTCTAVPTGSPSGAFSGVRLVCVHTPLPDQGRPDLIGAAAALHVGATLPGPADEYPGAVPAALSLANDEIGSPSGTDCSVVLDGDVIDCTSWRFAGAVTLLPAGPARFSVLLVGRPQHGVQLAFTRVTDLAEIGIESGEYDPGSVTGRRNAATMASGTDDAAVAEYRRLATHR
ncbi:MULTISPECIES: hypothetical protein [unclassified Pseudonocardia]|uniref:hypothetical protein n=1 Tax=unclassified Pseudonocardia TaxID=2619320 RepID=UPI0011AEAAFE|nr:MULTISPECIES: hypothetical protein [unclassified Pseudonocardia]